MIYLTEINLYLYEAITFQSQWWTSANQTPFDTVPRFKSITLKLWEQVFKPSFRASWIPANLCTSEYVLCSF